MVRISYIGSLASAEELQAIFSSLVGEKVPRRTEPFDLAHHLFMFRDEHRVEAEQFVEGYDEAWPGEMLVLHDREFSRVAARLRESGKPAAIVARLKAEGLLPH